MKYFRENGGITLIALVITIIVLLILAGVSIAMLTGENGLLTQAQKAKEQTEIATEEEQRTLLKYEYELAKLQGEISETKTFGEYSMEEEIKEKYGEDIKIGDTVNYEDNVEEYDGTWKVLGIENGQILLMSSNPVNNNYTINGKNGFLNLKENLNKECEKYSEGAGADSARSLRVEDINKITGYNPENPENVEKYRKDTIAEYGKTVTFTLEDGHVKYKCSNGQTLDTTLKSFEHVDGRMLGENLEISIVNNYFAYLYGDEDSISGSQDLSFHKVPSDGMKSLFLSGNLSWKYIFLANDSVLANESPERK